MLSIQCEKQSLGSKVQPQEQNNENNATNAPTSPCQAQINSLMGSISALAQLAAMESTDYQNGILKSPKSANNSCHFPLEQSLAEIERGSKESPLAQLTQSIHHFQSKIAILNNESDAHASEVDSLQQFIKVLQERNTNLEAEVQSLKKRNSKLIRKLEIRSKEKRTLKEYLSKAVTEAQKSEEQGKELEELRVAYQLQAHEHRLFQANRARTTSVDSNLSDGLDFVQSEVSGDELSAYSFGGTSLVTDEGIATLHLSPTPRSDASHSSFDSLPSATPSSRNHTFTLSFARGTKIGIRILEVPLDNTAPSTPALKPNPELTKAMLTPESDETQPTSNHNHHYGLPFHINLFHNNSKKPEREHPTQGESSNRSRIFVVSGYNDFDEKANTKPPIGSRIVGINNVCLPDTCTMTELLDSLRASSAKELVDDADGDLSTYSVTFRNEVLTSKQNDFLQKARKAEEEHWGKPEQSDRKGNEANCPPLDPPQTPVDDPTRPRDPSMSIGKFKFGFKGIGRLNQGGELKATESREPSETNDTQCQGSVPSKVEVRPTETDNPFASVLPFWKNRQQDESKKAATKATADEEIDKLI